MQKSAAQSSILKRILFTLGIVALYRLGASLPLPGVDVELLRQVDDTSGGISGVLDLFSGGAFSQASILALGVTPYITALIFFQLLENVVPGVKELKKQGPAGQRKLSQITRTFALAIAAVQAYGVLFYFHQGGIGNTIFLTSIFPDFSLVGAGLGIMGLLTGFLVLLWFATLISQKGVGNGMSVLILVSVVSGFMGNLETVRVEGGTLRLVAVLALVLGAVALVTILSLVERRVPLATSRRGERKREAGGMFIPLRPLQAGVAPAIFATAVIGLLSAAQRMIPEGDVKDFMADRLVVTDPANVLFTAALVMFFTYFYTALTFNTLEISEDLAKRGMFIVGVRPGVETIHRLAWTLSRLAVAGGFVLAFVTVLPVVAQVLLGVSQVPLAGISLLIATGVTLDAVKQYRAQRKLEDYDSLVGW